MEKTPLEPHTSAGSAIAERHPLKEAASGPQGLTIDPLFCQADVASPFDTVQWDLRTAAIKGENGEVAFEQTDCEIPAAWSQLATNVVVSKYFYGEVGGKERESSVRPLIHRVSRTIADWASQDGYFATAEDGERFYRDLTWLCLHQVASFNSPVWFNVGLYHQYGIKGAMCNWHWDKTTGTVVAAREPLRVPPGARPASSRVCRTTWRTSWSWPAARPCSSSSAPAPGPTSPRSGRTARGSPAAAGLPGRSPSCGSTIRSRPW